MSDAKSFHCSFCGKSQHEVRILIASSKVFICDECVAACIGIIGEQMGVCLDAIDELGRVVFGHPLFAHLARPSDFGLNHDGSLIEGGAA